MNRILNAVLGCSLAIFVIGCGGSEPIPLEIGSAAPTFSLPALGKATGTVTSEQFRGKITVLNFWSTSCAVCLDEIGDLIRVHNDGKAVVISIALEKNPDYVNRFLKERGILYTVALGDDDVFSRYDGFAIPYTLIIDRSGAIRKRVYGRIHSDELSKVIDEIDGSSVAVRTVQLDPAAP
jgi:peroxiredoxin